MRGKVPWWAVVVLGWVAMAAIVVVSRAGGAKLLAVARDTSGLMGGAWYMALLAGALLAIALAVAVARALVVLADSHKPESLLAILVPPSLWLLYNLATRLPALLRR